MAEKGPELRQDVRSPVELTKDMLPGNNNNLVRIKLSPRNRRLLSSLAIRRWLQASEMQLNIYNCSHLVAGFGQCTVVIEIEECS